MWRTRPVFISSTFVDMQAERDHLRTRVFPELEERLRARRHNLEWVDLRVGVATASKTDEHVRELHVLKVCLDEVRRCRPFLIVLLGDRYGWVPPEDRIRVAAEEARKGFSADVAGRSVTDLEIDFGVLSDPAQQPRSIFYFRAPLPYAQMPANVAALFSDAHDTAPGAADRVTRLAALKQRIETQLPDRVRHYSAQWDGNHVTGLEDWGKTVLEDIWSALADEIGPAAPADLPWQQVEHDALEDFIDDRARDFVGRKNVLARVIAVAAAPDAASGVCIVGDPGSGKSALFGELYRRLAGSDVFLLAHATGASVQAASVDAMLRRWIGELAAALGVDPGLADDADPETIDAAFARLLGQMAQRSRVVLLIDALDQFETTTRAQYLTWLPRSWPANARVIATAIAGTASQALAERPGTERLAMPPLDAAEARDIVIGICRRYHRELEPEVIDALLAKAGAAGPAWANPLWLVLAVEELNLLDADDFARVQRDYTGEPAARLRALMIDMVAAFPSDIAGLYAHTFARAEELFGPALARGFLGLIAVGRAGWRESDFRMLLPRVSGEAWDELEFAQLRRLFRGQLRRRGALAQWDFNHAQMRAAVRTRLAATGVAEPTLHALIASHLLDEAECRRDDPLRISETMVHLIGSDDWARAAAYFGDPKSTGAESAGAVRVLADRVIAAPRGEEAAAVHALARVLDAPAGLPRVLAADRFLLGLGDAVEYRSTLDARAAIVDLAMPAFERVVAENPDRPSFRHGLATAHGKAAELRRARGDLAGALAAYREAVALLEPLARSEPDAAIRQIDLAVMYSGLGDVCLEQGDIAGALAAYRDAVAIRQRLALREPADAARQRALALSLDRLGNVQARRNDFAGALASYRDCLAVRQRASELDPANPDLRRDISVSHLKIGDMRLVQGDPADALTSFRESLAIAERLAAQDPANVYRMRDVSVPQERIGNACTEMGDLAAAAEWYARGLDTRTRVAASDPANTVWQHDLVVSHERVGDTAMRRRDPDTALRSFRTGIAIIAPMVQQDPTNARWQFGLSELLEQVVGVCAAREDIAGAIAACEERRAGVEAWLKLDPTSTLAQRELWACHYTIGGMQFSQRDAAAAATSLAKAVAVIGGLSEREPGNPEWRDDLVKSLSLLGDAQAALGALGEHADALDSYRRGVAALEPIAATDPGNAPLQQSLALFWDKIAGVQSEQRDLAGARSSIERTVAIFGRLVEIDPASVPWQYHLARAHWQLGMLLVQLQQREPALASLRSARGIAAKLTAAHPRNPDFQRMLATLDRVLP
jgi:tetratricopeptide (TPR) repeat protein